jgi:lysozyme family protein
VVNIPVLISTENRRWASVQIVGSKAPAFQSVAHRLVAPSAKQAYQEIEADTKVPWFVVAVVHEREASQRWDRGLAQGDPWGAVSVHVPKGRGPFKSFRAAAFDALVNCAPKAARWTDWSVGGVLTLLEEYNGLGYAMRGVASPYIWAGTNQYSSGKYVSDGKYDPSVVDSQLGCAGLLAAMAQLDSSIKFGAMPAGPVPATRLSPSKPVVPVVPAVHDAPSIVPSATPHGPSLSHPAPGSIGAFIAKLFAAMFEHHSH